MAVSQGAAGGLPGMNLKAWALVDADGTLIKSSGVASAVKQASSIELTLSSAGGRLCRVTADTTVIAASSIVGLVVSVVLATFASPGSAVFRRFLIEIYE